MRSMGSGWRVLSAGLALLATSPAWAEVEFYQKADRTEVGSEDTVRLSVVVVDAPPSNQVQLPASRDFEVLSSSRSSQRSIQLSGGGPAVIREITTHTLILKPLRTGKLIIPPAVLTTADRTYRTEPIELTVKAGRLPVIPPGDSDLFLRASLDRDEVFVGEQTTLSLYIYSRVDLSSVDAVTMPKLEGFWSEDVERPTQLSGEQRIVNGTSYRAYLLRRQALFPAKAGTLTIPPAEAEMTTGFIFAGHRVHRVSNGLEVKVKPLPPGAPPGFASANAGSWKLSVDVSPTRVGLGQPLTVRVSLGGTGNVTNVTPPKLTAPAGLKVFEPITRNELTPLQKELQGLWMQEYMVVPLRAGTFTLPAMEFPYFDLRRSVYDVARTEPVTVTVRGGAGGVASISSTPPSMEGEGGMADPAPASPSTLQEACGGGEARSCRLLGERYEEGRGVPRDDRRAASLYEKACKAGDAPGCFALGTRHQDGSGVPKNLRRAATLFGKACMGGSAYGCSALSWSYRKGQGVPQNDLYAAVLGQEACEGRVAKECFNLGVFYREGRGVPKDESRAAALFEKACEGGSADGCHNLGVAYRAGRGVPKDESRAAALFEKACEAGFSADCAGR